MSLSLTLSGTNISSYQVQDVHDHLLSTYEKYEKIVLNPHADESDD